jgi:hypothetical protein
MIARVRYKAPLYLNIAATLCGLATLAKGLAGLGLPVLVFLAYLASPGTGSGSTARRSVSRSSCAFVDLRGRGRAVAPRDAVRHGRPFWDELYGDNHWRRLVVGRHGDRGTFEYFVRELGYAMLPWITLAPAALGAASGDASRGVGARGRAARDPGGRPRQGIFWFGAIWFVPATRWCRCRSRSSTTTSCPPPGLAIAIGCFLDDSLTRRDGRAAAAASWASRCWRWCSSTSRARQERPALHLAVLVRLRQHAGGRPWPPALDFRAR